MTVIDQPNALANTNNFEFEALAQAENYRRALLDEFGTVLRGEVVEVGAGIGQMTEALLQLPQVKRVWRSSPMQLLARSAGPGA